MAFQLQPPSDFICPLTEQLMVHPVLTRYGHRFERHAILSWLADGHGCCPITFKPLKHSNLVNDKNFQNKICTWAKTHNYDIPKDGQKPFPATGTTAVSSTHPISLVAAPDCCNKTNTETACVTSVPQRYLCPLTKQATKVPAMTRTGVNYEHSVILETPRGNGRIFPVTQQRPMPSGVITNSRLQREVQAWKERSGSRRNTAVNNTDTRRAPASTKNARPPIQLVHHILPQQQQQQHQQQTLTAHGGVQLGQDWSGLVSDQPVLTINDLSDVLNEVSAILDLP